MRFPVPNNEILEFNFTIALVSLFVAVFGLLMAWLIYNKNVFNDEKHFDPLEKILGILFTAIYNKWWIDELYNYVFVKPFYSICNILSGQIDSKVIDGFGNGLGSITKRASLIARKMQNGYIRSYALAIFFGLVVITTFIILIL